MWRSLDRIGRHLWLMAIALAGCMALLHAGAAVAQTDAAAGYPKAPVKMTVGFAPGGSNDIIARVVAQKLASAWANRHGRGHQVRLTTPRIPSADSIC